MGETEERLVWLAKTGDREAFSELVVLFESKVYRAAYALTGNEHDAKDLSQETFVRAFKGIGRFRGKSSFFTWLYRILLNTFKSWVRKRCKMPQASWEALEGAAQGNSGSTSALISSAASQRETVNRTYKAISALPDEQKMAIALHCLEEMTYREIAEVMRCSIGTVKSRIHAGRLALKRQLLSPDTRGEQQGGTRKNEV